MRKVVCLAAGAILVFTLAGCKKKEEAPVTGAPGAPGITMPPAPAQVVVPDTVKGKWTSVKLTIEDKVGRTAKDVTIKLGAEYAIPGSNLKIKVGDFLPDFKMEGTVITSASDKLNNPAVQVTVTEDGKVIFDKWLYSKFPAIHPFQHERFGLLLKEGMKG